RTNEAIAEKFVKTHRQEGINLLIYKNQQLYYWSSYRAFPNHVQRIKEGTSFIRLSNGYYELVKKTEGAYVFIFIITVKTQYNIENQYLQNEIWPGLFNKNTLEIASFNDKETTEIFNLNKEYLFTVKLSSQHADNIYTSLQLWLWVLGTFC